MIKAYGYEQKFINDLDPIENCEEFLNLEGLNFLLKSKKENKNIVFVFHGAIGNAGVGGEGVGRIIFRGYDWQIENTDIVCICDYLLSQYQEYNVNWTLSTKKHDAESKYLKLIDKIISKKQYDKILFTGTSAGGYPSIKFASLFNQEALVSNSQIYLEEYEKDEYEKGNIYGYFQLMKMVNDNQDELLYKEKEIESIILKSQPKKIVLYNNVLDKTFKRDVIPFLDFIRQNELQNILEVRFFIYKEKIIEPWNHHNIFFPERIEHIKILEKYFNC